MAVSPIYVAGHVGWLGFYATPSVYQPAGGPEQIVVAGAVELTGCQATTGERLWWARGVTIGPAALPLVAGDFVYTIEPTSGDEGGAPPFSGLLKKYDKNNDGKLQIAELTGETLSDKIMYRIAKSVDKNTGNADGAVTEAEWTKAFNSTAPGGGLVRIRLKGAGDVTATNVVWRHTKGVPYVEAALLYQGVLYVVRTGGILTAFDPETGKVLRQARLKDGLGEYYAQPVAGDGKIYFVSEEGKVSVIKAGVDWEMLSSGEVDGSVVATPAIADSRIYLRTDENLYCFETARGNLTYGCLRRRGRRESTCEPD